MKKQIWKYKLSPNCDIIMPVNAEILTVQVQRDEPKLWVRVTPTNELETRHFEIYGTRHKITKDNLKYISTFQINNGTFVFHVFEVLNE